MDAFPANLSEAGVRAVVQEQRDKLEAAQQNLLVQTRLRVYNQIMADARREAKPGDPKRYSTLELPDALGHECKRQLVRELCARFPGKVAYRRVVEYLDVDEFLMIKDEANPPVSFDYRVHFE